MRRTIQIAGMEFDGSVVKSMVASKCGLQDNPNGSFRMSISMEIDISRHVGAEARMEKVTEVVDQLTELVGASVKLDGIPSVYCGMFVVESAEYTTGPLLRGPYVVKIVFMNMM